MLGEVWTLTIRLLVSSIKEEAGGLLMGWGGYCTGRDMGYAVRRPALHYPFPDFTRAHYSDGFLPRPEHITGEDMTIC